MQVRSVLIVLTLFVGFGCKDSDVSDVKRSENVEVGHQTNEVVKTERKPVKKNKVDQLTDSAKISIEQLIEQLDDDDFEIRESAVDELIERKTESILAIEMSFDGSSIEAKNRMILVLEALYHVKETKEKIRIIIVKLLKMKCGEFFFKKLKLIINPWVSGFIPSNTVASGKEVNETPLFLARCIVNGEVYVGKIQRAWTGVNIAYLGNEKKIKNYEVYVGLQKWVNSKYDKIPSNAFAVGRNDNKNIYAIRAKLKGGNHIGYYVQGEKSGLISWGGEVHKVESFQILVE